MKFFVSVDLVTPGVGEAVQNEALLYDDMVLIHHETEDYYRRGGGAVLNSVRLTRGAPSHVARIPPRFEKVCTYTRAWLMELRWN